MQEGKISKRRRMYEALMKAAMWISVACTCALVAFLILYVLVKGLPHISWSFLSGKPSYLSGNIGILPDMADFFSGKSIPRLILVWKIPFKCDRMKKIKKRRNCT